MSLYNMMFGVNPAALYCLPLLGKHPDQYPRFRDCFLGDEEHPEHDGKIIVYTRVGGGNRGDYREQINALRASPGYITDYDDSFDCTFASFVFDVPEEWKEDFSKIREGRMSECSDAYWDQLRKVWPKLKDKIDELQTLSRKPREVTQEI
jgi:hypothetical protein